MRLRVVSPVVLLLAGCDAAVVKMGADADSALPPLVPDIDVPLELDVGNAILGESVSAELLVRNAGEAMLSGSVLLSDGGDDFVVDLTRVDLEPGGESVLNVRFTADTEGSSVGTIRIDSNDPDEPAVEVRLKGNGVLDRDGDGDPDDCNDADPEIYHGAQETWYDGVDQDCDGASDFDQDRDGHDSDAHGGDDCDDTRADVSPSADEVWYDGVDQACDGGSDFDQDGDGIDAASQGGADCDDTAPMTYPGAFDLPYDGVDADCSGGSDNDADGDGYDAATYGGDDCDDGDARAYPGAAEVPYDGVDADCSGGSDLDADGDGHDAAAYGGDDCDDTRADVSPSAVDVPYDGLDADCSGGTDFDGDGDGHDAEAYGGDDCDDARADVSPDATELFYDGVDADCSGGSDFDADGDGVDALLGGGADCDDTRSDVNPGAVEVYYDGVDADCSGDSDRDADGDGQDAVVAGGLDCDDARADVFVGAADAWYDGVDSNCDGANDYDADGDRIPSAVYGGLDCDDANAAVRPGVTETCDDVDNDCDGSVDEGLRTTVYADGDRDGYGSGPSSTTCAVAVGEATVAGDCDDANLLVNPSATEVCDGIDNDCEGGVDEGVATTYYVDGDGDGFGSATTTLACALPAGHATVAGDCDDTRGTVSPLGLESCDGRDNDCDGATDEGVTTTYYRDADGDGTGATSVSTAACAAPTGYVALSGDCDDTRASVEPGAPEACDDLDNDCDGSTDEGLSTSTWYRDADADGFGTSGTSVADCAAPAGYVSTGGDCNDTEATAYPGAVEAPYDALDNDCDAIQDEMIATAVSAWTVRGSTSNDELGEGQVGSAADVDGDGYAELVIGGPSLDFTGSSGTAYEGALAFYDVGSKADPAQWGAAWFRLVNVGVDDFGAAWAEVGDGVFSVTAPSEDGAETNDGSVHTFNADDVSGAGSSVSVTFAATYYTYGRVYGPASNVYFGSDVASGDVDADGRNDIVVGANGDDSSSRGRVYVFSWGDGYEDSTVVATSASYAYFRGASNNDRLGASVGVADFNGDGYDDVVACASGRDGSGGATDAGACYVQRGSTTSYSASSIASSAVATITGTVANDGVGGTRHAVSTGDFDGDGTPDLAIGASGYDGYATNGGGVGIFDGGLLSGGVTFPTAQWLVRGDGALGISAALGDIDGDGIADLLAGATTAGGNKGVTYMIEGGIATGTYTVPADQFASWTGDSSGDLFGFSVGGFRDLDADGTPDVVVGAPFQDAGGTTNFGRVHVLSGY